MSYTQYDELRVGEVLDMTEDMDGIMWFTSKAGIIRHDGINFKYYTPGIGDTTTFQSNEFQEICADSNNNIWTIEDQNVYKYDREQDRFVYFTPANTPTQGAIEKYYRTIHVDEDHLYLGSHTGYVVLNLKTLEKKYYEINPEMPYKNWHHSLKNVVSIHQDRFNKNQLILGGMGQLFFLNKATHQIDSKIEIKGCGHCYGKPIKAIHQQNQDTIWVAIYGGGLVQYDLKNQKVVHQFIHTSERIQNMPFHILVAFVPIDEVHFLLPHVHGLPIIFNYKNYTWNYLEDNNILKNSWYTYASSSKVFWLGGKQGLTKLIPHSYTKHLIPNLKNQMISRVQVLGDELYVGDRNRTVHKYKIIDGFDSLVPLGESPGVLLTESMNEDAVQILNKDTITRTTTLGSEKIICTNLPHHREKILLGDTMFLQDETTLYILDVKTCSRDTIDVNDWLEHKVKLGLGYMYIKSPSMMYLYDDRNLVQVDLKKGMARNITAIHTIPYVSGLIEIKDNIFIGDGALGLVKLDKNTLELKPNVFFNKPFKTNSFYNEGDSILWLSTFTSLYGYDIDKDQVVYRSTGFYPFPFRSQISKSGALIYTHGGSELIIINSTYDFHKTDAFKLNHIAINDSIYQLQQVYKLPYDKNDIEINWGLQYFGEPNNLNTYIMLEGYIDNWFPTSGRNQHRFSNLSPGTYTLKAKATTINDEVHETWAKIHISAPLYKQWWFVLLAGLTAVGIAFGMQRSFNNRKLEKNRLLTKVAEYQLQALKSQLNPHFIFNCLNAIKSLIQKNRNESATRYLVTFSTLLRNFLDYNDEEQISLEDELEFIEKYLQMELLRVDKGFQYEIRLAPEIDPTDIYVPPLLLQPFVENAIWHGLTPLLHLQKGILIINVSLQDDILEIAIHDNGIGIKASKEAQAKNVSLGHKARGTSIIVEKAKLNAKLLNRTIDIYILDSQHFDRGTTVQISIVQQDGTK